jgi:hypothetical protein
MKTVGWLLPIVIICLVSCNRTSDGILGFATEPLLVKSITKDSAGSIKTITHYDPYGVVSDSAFSINGAVSAVRAYQHNLKGKITGFQWYIPVFYTAGNHWEGKSYFDNDTILKISEFYTNEHISTRTLHCYSSTGLPSVDSVYRFGLNPGLVLIYYNYDTQRRILSSVSVNLPNDTTTIHTYQYTANTVEEEMTSISAASNYRSVSRKITEYRSDGKILSAKDIDQSGQVTNEIRYTYDGGGRLLDMKSINLSYVSEETYTYDANGWLVKKLITNSNGQTEYLFTNNGVHGKPEKMEQYTGGKLLYTTTYYYQ